MWGDFESFIRPDGSKWYILCQHYKCLRCGEQHRIYISEYKNVNQYRAQESCEEWWHLERFSPSWVHSEWLAEAWVRGKVFDYQVNGDQKDFSVVQPTILGIRDTQEGFNKQFVDSPPLYLINSKEAIVDAATRIIEHGVTPENLDALRRCVRWNNGDSTEE